jgi:ankyrin repeat protein
VEVLLKAGADPNIPNNENDFPIHVACGYGALKIVNLLLDYNASVETKDGKGNTPLLLAAREDDDVHIAIVDALLRAGADINAENDEGDNALMYPCSWDLHKITGFRCYNAPQIITFL